ncbi:MAG: PD-(D/E)XK nuclease family protein [Deltaproteobacteria bacterium]|nr:PD-(D/E)XK nuclease family protein [Deltaproteobacteria bacterium]MBI3294397.1 PD-(D/E)XK nuclease family protein [Deltaproteobacteria bacterium]
MLVDKTTYFFEDHVARDWFRVSTGISSPPTQVLTEFLLSRAEQAPLPRTERLALLTEMLPTSERPRAGLYLETIEQLRETFILLPEHVEHCFSLLSPSPKNILLQALLHAYFSTELSRDPVALAWEAIGQLKASRDRLFGEVIFVRSLEPSLIFSELATAFRNVSESVTEIELAGLGDHSSADTHHMTGTEAVRMEHLADQARRAISDGKKQVLVPFCGEDHHRHSLEVILASRGLTVSLLPQPSQRPDHPLKHWRQAPFPILDRLKIHALALLNPDREARDPRWNDYWGQCRAQNAISEAQRGWLCESEVPPASFETLSPKVGDVVIGPFLIPPERPFSEILPLLADDPFRQKRSTLLREDERNHLIRQGFPLPSRTDFRARVVAQCGLASTLFAPPDWGLCPHIEPTALAPVVNRTLAPNDGNLSLPERPLSATALQNYSRCPSIYLYSNRLKLRDASAIDPNGFALLLGDATHRTLENFFRQSERSFDDLNGLFLNTVKTAHPTLPDSHPTMTRLRARFKRIAAEVPQIEKQLAAILGPTTPDSLEMPFEAVVGGVRARGKIDRIDRTPDNRFVLLDYKTGTVDFSPNHIESGEDFQVPLYLFGTESLPSVIGFLFYDLKKGEVRRGLLKEELVPKEAKGLLTRGHVVSPEKFERIMATSRDHIARIAGLIAQGNFVPTPSCASCQSCQFGTLCRRRHGTDG